jgi:hypothetical protein
MLAETGALPNVRSRVKNRTTFLHPPARAVIAAAALSIGLGGCGGVEPPEAASRDVARAGANTVLQRTARFEIDLIEREGAVRFPQHCFGAVDLERKRYRLACTEGGNEAVETEVISTETVEYSRFVDHGAANPVGGKWIATPVDAGDDRLALLDPVGLLERLRSASSKVETIGREQVRGVPTDHVRLTVARDQLDLDAEKSEDRSETLTVEIWIDGEGVIRRFRAEDTPGAVGTLEFFDFGAAVEIEPPPAGEVAEMGETEFEPSSCPDGDMSPLSEELVTRTLREHGIDIHRDPAGCYRDDVAVDLINQRIVGVGARAEDEERRRSEGVVLCALSSRPEHDAGLNVERTGEDVEVDFAVANLECTIFPEGKGSQEQIDRLANAFEALRRRLD